MSKAKMVHVNISFLNTDGTDALKSYATDKVTHSLQKFIHKDTEARVVLKVEKNRHIAEISFHTDGHDFQASEETDDLYASIDKLTTTIQRQLRKNKEKLTSHY